MSGYFFVVRLMMWCVRSMGDKNDDMLGNGIIWLNSEVITSTRVWHTLSDEIQVKNLFCFFIILLFTCCMVSPTFSLILFIDRYVNDWQGICLYLFFLNNYLHITSLPTISISFFSSTTLNFMWTMPQYCILYFF